VTLLQITQVPNDGRRMAGCCYAHDGGTHDAKYLHRTGKLDTWAHRLGQDLTKEQLLTMDASAWFSTLEECVDNCKKHREYFILPGEVYGRVVCGCKLLGVHGMELKAGQLVALTPCNNLGPNKKDWMYARPALGVWSDGVVRGLDDSILLCTSDFVLVDF
jgi:hypothetical protein